MILFVSGRCDIPAFYTPWFFQRLKEGYVDVRNPYDPHQISRIFLDEKNIDAILFCTKNPLPMLSRLDEIPFPFLFHTACPLSWFQYTTSRRFLSFVSLSIFV